MTLVVDPETFSREWFAAWNAHDIEAVLAHFHQDAVFTSLYGAEIAPHTGGVFRVRGPNLRRRPHRRGARHLPVSPRAA